MTIWIRFIKPWGHPTKYEVYGPGQIVGVSEWQASHLVNAGYAELVDDNNLKRI